MSKLGEMNFCKTCGGYSSKLKKECPHCKEHKRKKWEEKNRK